LPFFEVEFEERRVLDHDPFKIRWRKEGQVAESVHGVIAGVPPGLIDSRPTDQMDRFERVPPTESKIKIHETKGEKEVRRGHVCRGGERERERERGT
jgi:hypothetical protein